MRFDGHVRSSSGGGRNGRYCSNGMERGVTGGRIGGFPSIGRQAAENERTSWPPGAGGSASTEEVPAYVRRRMPEMGAITNDGAFSRPVVSTHGPPAGRKRSERNASVQHGYGLRWRG